MAKKRKFGNFDWGKVNEEMKKQDQTSSREKDERFYETPLDEDGNFLAYIRFLPPQKGEDLPKVKYYNHFFKDRGKGYYVEKCPTTIGKPCPACEANSEAWNSGDEATARRRKRQTYYVSNILVIEDKQNPENEGKVFLYKYGKKLNEIIMETISPSEDDEDAIDVFDYYTGADMKLKLYVKEEKQENGKTVKYPQYDKCRFKSPSELYDGDDDKIEEVHNKLYSLSQFISEDSFKSYEELVVRFEKVTGKEVERDEDEDADDENTSKIVEDVEDKEKEEKKPRKSNSKKKDEDEEINLNLIDDDDEFFSKVRDGEDD